MIAGLDTATDSSATRVLAGHLGVPIPTRALVPKSKRGPIDLSCCNPSPVMLPVAHTHSSGARLYPVEN